MTYLIYLQQINGTKRVKIARDDGGRDDWTDRHDRPTVEEARRRLRCGGHQVRILGQETEQGVAEVQVTSFGKL